jgi:hypothetical protein
MGTMLTDRAIVKQNRQFGQMGKMCEAAVFPFRIDFNAMIMGLKLVFPDISKTDSGMRSRNRSGRRYAMTGAATRLFRRRVSLARNGCRLIGAGTVVLMLFATGQSARGSQIVDQSYLPFHPSSGFDEVVGLSPLNPTNLPLGQQFVPTLTSMNFLDLWIEDAASNDPATATIQVNIRATSISGTILGTSTAVAPAEINLSGGTTLTEFDFSSPISLTPGATYVIQAAEINAINDNRSFGWVGGPPGSSTYAPGEAYINGTLQPTFDFAFEEGVESVPEPSSWLMAAMAVIACVGFVLKRRRVALI